MKGKHVKSENIIKKVVCMVLIIMMLTSNVITPVKLLADELDGVGTEQASSTTNGSNTGENGSGESGASSAGSNENSEGSSGNGSENSSSVGDNNNSETNASKSEDCSDGSNGSAADGSNSSVANGSNSSATNGSSGQENTTDGADNETGSNSDNEQNNEKNNSATSLTNANSSSANNGAGSNLGSTTNENGEEQSLMLRSMPLGNTNEANSEEISLTPQELEESIKPTTKEDIEKLKQEDKFKTKNDSYQIRTFATSFLSGANKDSNGNFVWTPTDSVAGHEFTFRVNYATSGEGELPAGSVQITIPKQILRDRNGNLADKFMMSLPTLQEYEEEEGITEFVYKEDNNYIIVYNPKEITAAVNGYFEISYSTSKTTFNYKDYDSSNTGLVTAGGTASDPFYAIMSVNTGDETLNNISNDTNLFINTTAKLQSTQKRYPSIYRSWNSSWMATKPADADDYYYLVWEIQSYIGTATQMYNFSLEDTITDLTENLAESGYEFVGYKLSGQKYYSSAQNAKATIANQTASGYRYDYVLTRHKKSTYTGRTYKLKNTITATVDPIDQVDEDTKATSSNTFNWDPHFNPPVGHFNLFKYGNNNWRKRFSYYWDYANYDLDKLQDYEETGVNELKGFKYFTETIGYAYPWTIEEGASTDNPYAYGKNPVTYDTWDDSLYLEGDETPMNTDDYYLEYLTYSVQNQDATFDDFYQKLNTTSPTYDDNEIITYYAKFGDRNADGGNDWVEIGTYNLKTKALTPNADYVAEMTTSKITFKEGVHATGWRFTTSNKHYYTYITVTPYFVLTNSDYVKTKVKDENNENKSSIKIQNNVSTNITNYKGETIFEKTDWAFDYARVTYYNSDITKNVSSVSNNRAKRKYTVTWRVNAWENATSGTGQSEYIWQDSGTFYDLIPSGGTIDTSSIQIRTQAGFLDENEYTYEVIENYNKSGRAMLIVKIKEQAQYYTVFYNTIHTWEDMKDYGRKVLNPVAYETGNSKITKGFPDNGGNLSLLNKVLYNDLDKTTDDKKFIYAESTHDINALTAASSGLDKKVKTSKDSDYSYETAVEPDGSYSYRLRFQNTFMNKAKNLILFDSIENFEVIDSTAGITKTSGWKGILDSVDITQLKNKEIDAKVYVSTIENLNLEENNDITKTAVWQLATEETDFSTAKAIAIDMTKTLYGEDFVLDAGDSVTAVLHMKAPNEVSEEVENNPYTYNNVYISNTLIDELESSEDYFIHQDYTKVKYHVIADVPLYKVNEQDETEGIKGITFRLYGTSRYGTEVDMQVTSDKNGFIVFKDVEAGTYTLQEYEGSPDWIEDHKEHTVVISINKEVTIDGVRVTSNDSIKIANTPRAHADIIAYKKDLVNKNKSLEGVKFKLEGTSDYGNEILMYAISDSNGKVTFEDIEKGKYTLTEVSTIDGYIISQNTFQVIVDENNNYEITGYNSEWATNGYYNIYNEPLHTVYFSKRDLVNKNKTIEGVTFKLTGTSDYGTSVEKTATSNEGGKVTFEGLEKGTYTFVEESTTEEYILNPNTFMVEIDRLGNFSITGEGVEQASNDDFCIYNEPYHSFYFTKKDSYNDENLGGAKFNLYGISNLGSTYNETATSIDGTGIVNFEKIEAGTYILKEIESPNTSEVTYVPDEEERIVEVSEIGVVTLNGETIWPLSERADKPYVWYNTRNKGQITITKKWVDDVTDNNDRQKPTIYISTKAPEVGEKKAYFRMASSSSSIIDYVTTGNVTAFERNTTLTEAEVLAKSGVTRLDNDSTNSNTKYKIYAWVESGKLYWWTKADVAVLPANLDYYFNNETGLTDVSFTGIKAGEYWTGTPGSETTTTSITNMKNMFYNCTSITNLDISSLNNSGITEETKTNMQYAFGNNGSTPAGAMTALKYITVGENFKLFDTSVLPAGKWKNQTTSEEKTNTDLTGNILAGTYEYVKEVSVQIGDTVNYVTSLNGVTLDNWKVFDIEDGYVYLIYGDYMPNSAVSGKISNLSTLGSYAVYSDSRVNLINAMKTKSNWSQLLAGTINGTAIDYTGTTDTNIYANGSPTLELWIDSWNKKYPNDKIYTAYLNNMSDGLNGNYVGTTENPTSTSISSSVMNQKEGYSNTLYYPHTSSWKSTYAYWLASPSATGNVMRVGYYGYVDWTAWSGTGLALRPVVCLPSSVLD